jgi:hypothetical protein
MTASADGSPIRPGVRRQLKTDLMAHVPIQKCNHNKYDSVKYRDNKCSVISRMSNKHTTKSKFYANYTFITKQAFESELRFRKKYENELPRSKLRGMHLLCIYNLKLKPVPGHSVLLF